ncbi:MAG TPA: META domain-containing protein, partial [Nakamurella sp.]
MTTGVRVRGFLGLLGAGVLLVGLTACASGGSAGSGGTTSASASPSPTTASGSATASPGGRAAGELDGASFVATEVTGTHTIAPNSTITLTFEGGSLSANAGCNSMAGRYVAVGGKLTAPQLASTMMACDEALMAQDAWLAAFLAAGPTYTLDGDTLTLTNGTDTIVLGPAPSGAEVLESTGWKVTDVQTISDQANTMTAVDPTLSAWMRFKAGEVAFNNSCNLGGGPVEIGDDTLTFGALRTTLIFCDGPSGQLEQTMSAVLQGETTYSITSGGGTRFLRIMSADGSTGLGLTADDTV